MKFKTIAVFLFSFALHAEELHCTRLTQKLPLYSTEANAFFVTKEYTKARNKYLLTAQTAVQIIENCAQMRNFDFNLFNRYYSYTQERLENINNIRSDF